MPLTGSLVNAYFICKRKFWFYARQFNPAPDATILLLGKIISETAYAREKKEIALDGIKIDLVRKVGEDILVCEIKKSSKALLPAQMQLAFYLYRLKQHGILAKGQILIPKERKVINFVLDQETEKRLLEAISDMNRIMQEDRPPPPINAPLCKKCIFFEFCYS